MHWKAGLSQPFQCTTPIEIGDVKQRSQIGPIVPGIPQNPAKGIESCLRVCVCMCVCACVCAHQGVSSKTRSINEQQRLIRGSLKPLVPCKPERATVQVKFYSRRQEMNCIWPDILVLVLHGTLCLSQILSHPPQVWHSGKKNNKVKHCVCAQFVWRHNSLLTQGHTRQIKEGLFSVLNQLKSKILHTQGFSTVAGTGHFRRR